MLKLWFTVLLLFLNQFYGTQSEKCKKYDENPKCSGVTCDELRTCNFPKKSIDFCDPFQGCCMKRVCTCKGTENSMSTTGGEKQRYDLAKWRYENCTLIDGNLELVALHRDITFTRHIVEVTGYVIIGRNSGKYIDLSSLRLIRGFEKNKKTVVACKGTANVRNLTTESEEYALYIADNKRDESGLEEIWMPHLTEISSGNVYINNNPRLCFVNTILWEDIFEDSSQVLVSGNSSDNETGSFSKKCSACPSSCSDGRCWSSEPHMCQTLTKTGPMCKICQEAGLRFVMRNGSRSCDCACCAEECAGGCFHSTKSACYGCKEKNDDGSCVNNCPFSSELDRSEKVKSTEAKYQFAGYCVKQCPKNAPLNERFCQTYCPPNKFDFSNNTCQKCDESCNKNICRALGVKQTPIENDTFIHSNNIKYFNKNCTIIEGSLIFKRSTFTGDGYCLLDRTPITDLSVFENVREITGFLAIEEWPGTNLCVFKNLRRIHGKELWQGQYALSIFTDEHSHSSDLRYLCLNSLKQIDNGAVKIERQPRLCFTDKVNWNSITLNILEARTYIAGEKIADKCGCQAESECSQNCGKVLIFRNRRLCHVDQRKWKRIISSTSAFEGSKIKGRGRSCANCNRNCDDQYGCWGDSNTNCVQCLNYTDYTNSLGKVAPNWIKYSNGTILPGNNETTCVAQCDLKKGVYVSQNKTCLPCDVECEKECKGPGPTNCTKCRNKRFKDTCVAECHAVWHYERNNTCYPCNESCIDGGCNGPLAAFDISNGCVACYYHFDNETLTHSYRGTKCLECDPKKIDLDCQHGCLRKNGSSKFECIVPPKDNTVAVVVPVVLVIIILVISISIYYYYKHKVTIKHMRRTLGEAVVGERQLDENETMPLTPSGAAPNQAHLRIVKDSELVMGVLLGSGAFGEVHKGIWTPLNIQGEKIKIAVAVKTLKTLEEFNPSANNEIMDEAYVMASVDCPYLVRLLGILMTSNVSLITQLMPLGSLLEYVRDVKNHEKIHSRQMLTWFVQIAKGMLYLQEKHLVHRDLAARNVLVRTPNHVKITDFGLAKMLGFEEDTYQAEGGKLPIKWLAIECITDRIFSHHSDVWAFGITCWELLTFGSRPYEGVRAAEILDLLTRGERLPQPPTATIEVYMLLVKCWMVDRTSRPSFGELVSECSRMAMDPARYLVIQNDAASCLSPNQIEEDLFFQMLMEDEKIDDATLVDEPDQYLLSRQLSNQQRPVYANQEAVNKTQLTHPAIHGPERLFSRSTPSANIEPMATSSTSTETRTGYPDQASGMTGADQDDVFSEAAHSSKQFINGDVRNDARNNRIDSEENHRYIEDPTKKLMYQKASDQKLAEAATVKPSYDDNDYLLPTESKAPVYLDPEGVTNFPSALVNDTYIDTPPSASSIPSTTTPGPSNAAYTPLATCHEENEHDYVNTKEKDTNTWFANEEYMATDSGIGEDSQSLLSRGANGKHGKRNESAHSSSDENVSVKEPRVQFKPNNAPLTEKKPWSTSSEGSTTSCNSPTALNNPEYMYLNASTSNNNDRNSSTADDRQLLCIM